MTEKLELKLFIFPKYAVANLLDIIIRENTCYWSDL